MEKRTIVNFYELDEKWQSEALSNLDDMAYDAMYLEPLSFHVPGTYILWDLADCMRAGGVHEGFTYNTAITISNNSALLLNIDDDFQSASIKFV